MKENKKYWAAVAIAMASLGVSDSNALSECCVQAYQDMLDECFINGVEER